MAAKKKKRRHFTPEYKSEVVALFRKSGKTGHGEVSRDLDLTETSVRAWIRQAEIDEGKGFRRARSRPREREELSALKREVKTLRLEREIER